MLKTGTTIIVALLSAGSLAAQQHQHGPAVDTSGALRQAPQQQMGMMQRGMMAGQGMAMMPGHDVMQRAMRLSPERLLAHKDALGLTAQQAAQLQQLAAGDSAAPQARAVAMRQAGEDLSRRFDAAKPDTAAVRVAAERLVAEHGALHARRIATAAAVRGILSAGQLERAMLLGQGDMQPMMGGMMQGGMMQSGRRDSPREHARHHVSPQDGR